MTQVLGYLDQAVQLQGVDSGGHTVLVFM